MADKQKHIDELARELMQPYQEETPSGQVWAGIRRRMFLHNLLRNFWFWSSATAILILATFFIMNGQGGGIASTGKAHYSPRTGNTTLAELPTTVDNSRMNPSITEGQTTSYERESHDFKAKSNYRKGRSSEETGLSKGYKQNITAAEATKSQATKQTQAANNSNNDNANNAPAAKAEADAKDNQPEKHAEEAKKQHDPAGKNESNTKTHQQNEDAQTNKTTEKKNDTNTRQIETGKSLVEKQTDSGSTEQNSEINDDADTKESTDISETTKMEETALSFAMPVSVSSELFISYYNSGYILDAIGDTDPSLAEFKKESETPEWQVSAGLGMRFEYSLFFLQAEANYRSYKINASYNWNKITTNSYDVWDIDTLYNMFTDTVNAFYDSINNKWHYHIDSVELKSFDSTKHLVTDTSIKHRQVRTFQDLRYWEFPLLIGHSWNTGRWDFEASTGIAVGFFTGSSGKVFTNNENYLIEYDREQLPFRDVNLIWLGRAGAAYRLNDHWSILGRADMRYGLNSIYRDNYKYSRKIKSLGFSFGIRYKF